MGILEKLKNNRIIFDGGYGTNLQKCGLLPGELPETWNLTHSDVITKLHGDYLAAGCDILKTNTFGANLLKFTPEELEKIISAAVKNAKNAIESGAYKEKYIAFDIGPLGKLLKPLGDLDFEDAVGIFSHSFKLGEKYGADLILIETMNDSLETKAAVLAAKESTKLPIFVTNAYDENNKLMTGASPFAMVALLEGLGVDALGVNCSLGPEKMLSVAEELLKEASVPVIVNPNAGMPVIKNGKTEFNVTPKDFSASMIKIANAGGSILGGCCGTTPEHIKELSLAVKPLPAPCIAPKNKTVVSSYAHSVEFSDVPILIGERINPTGKSRFKNALRENDFDYILKEGLLQEENGAHILDVNVGLPEINEPEVLKKTVELLQSVLSLPLQIDTSDFAAMEAALRIYNGKPLINSVNGKKEVMDAVFPLAAKYGGVVIALTLDDNGIPDTFEGRMKIADNIINEAKKYGIGIKDLIFDPLAMTISSDNSSALVTLKCVKEFAKRGIKTSLGVSNVSFGLPERSIINSTFFAMALNAGLSAAIMNPNSKEMMDVYYGFCALCGLDKNCERYISYAVSFEKHEVKEEKTACISSDDSLKNAIVKGMNNKAVESAKELIKNTAPLDIINEAIIPALNEIGKKFENGQVFLPQLLMSAEAAKEAFGVIKEYLSGKGIKRDKKYKIILATVKGDIHDIGKNIVKVLLENYDFDVLDLGKDVEPSLIVKTAEEENVRLVGLSALMTTTVPSMEETIKLLKDKLPWVKVVVGGAVLTKEYAKMVNADKYAKDAMETVRYAESLM